MLNRRVNCPVCLLRVSRVLKALAPVTGAFQHLGQVIASAVRISDLTDQKPEVTFPDTQTRVADRVSLTLRDVQFTYPEQSQQALKGFLFR